MYTGIGCRQPISTAVVQNQVPWDISSMLVLVNNMRSERSGQAMAARGKLTRGLWIALGCACPGLGTIGVVLPILPTVPFYMATVFCFAKSSERLHDWFVGTSLYEKRLEGLVAHRTMTMTDKLRVVWSVTLVMGIGFALMSKVPAGRAILAVVWVCHLLYFFLRVQTIPEGQAPEGE